MSARSAKLKVIRSTKDFLLATRLLQIFQPLGKLFSFLYNFNLLTSWVHANKNKGLLVNDFYRRKRRYEDREKSFEAIIAHYNLSDTPVCYMEFGVASGYSFKWWLAHNNNAASSFYGFDTFEGLPENWGLFSKGDMHSPIPEVNDSRAMFIKGIFQDTMTSFLANYGQNVKGSRRIIHMDADLFSATLFALSQLYPYLQKGDIIMFDEFSVYDHEFMAFRYFTDCFYVNLKPIAAQNNFYHAAFEIV